MQFLTVCMCSLRSCLNIYIYTYVKMYIYTYIHICTDDLQMYMHMYGRTTFACSLRSWCAGTLRLRISARPRREGGLEEEAEIICNDMKLNV